MTGPGYGECKGGRVKVSLVDYVLRSKEYSFELRNGFFDLLVLKFSRNA